MKFRKTEDTKKNIQAKDLFLNDIAGRYAERR